MAEKISTTESWENGTANDHASISGASDHNAGDASAHTFTEGTVLHSSATIDTQPTVKILPGTGASAQSTHSTPSAEPISPEQLSWIAKELRRELGPDEHHAAGSKGGERII